MYHSITFGTKNTWDDWHLIPSSRPVVNPPGVKTNFVEIPGGSVVLDLTEAGGGRPLYKNRTGSFEFYVENGFQPWAELYSNILTCLNGQVQRMILEDDPDYFYEGRFTLNAWKSDKQRSVITINYSVGPYKQALSGNIDKWLWDPFNFNTGVIRDYKNLAVNGPTTVRVIGLAMPVNLIFFASNSSMTVSYQDTVYALPKGETIIYEIVITEGENILTFNGSGLVSIQFVGGVL